MSKRKGQHKEYAAEKKFLLAVDDINHAIKQQGVVLQDFIYSNVLEPLMKECPTLVAFRASEGGWKLDLTLHEREYHIECMSLPRVAVEDPKLTIPDHNGREPTVSVCRDYKPTLQIAGPRLDMVSGEADAVITKLKEAFLLVKAEVLEEAYQLIMEAQFHRMFAWPIRDHLIRDGHLKEGDWPGVSELSNGERIIAFEAAKWGTPQSDQELLDKAIQVRKDSYALEMKRLEYSKRVDDLLKPYSVDFEVGYKLRRSVADSHNYHCHDSPLHCDTWKEFKETWARRFGPYSVPEYASTPNFEEEYAKRKPELDKEGQELEAELQAALTKARMN